MDTLSPRYLPFGNGNFLAVPGAAFLLYLLVTDVWAIAQLVQSMMQQGWSDPSATGRMFAELIMTLTVRGFTALPALAVLVLALLACRYRAVWFYWYLLFVSIPLLFLAPIGTLFGIWFLIYLRKHRREFVPANPTGGSSPTAV